MGQWLRRLRGAVGNALVWSAGWFLAGIGITAALFATGGIVGIPFWQAALFIAKNVAGVGFLMGAGFSLYLGIAGRSSTLDELAPWRLSLGAAAAAAAGTALATVATSGITFLPLGVLASVACGFGGLAGATAFTTLKIAQSELPEGRPRAEFPGARDDLLSVGRLD